MSNCFCYCFALFFELESLSKKIVCKVKDQLLMLVWLLLVVFFGVQSKLGRILPLPQDILMEGSLWDSPFFPMMHSWKAPQLPVTIVAGNPARLDQIWTCELCETWPDLDLWTVASLSTTALGGHFNWLSWPLGLVSFDIIFLSVWKVISWVPYYLFTNWRSNLSNYIYF